MIELRRLLRSLLPGSLRLWRPWSNPLLWFLPLLLSLLPCWLWSANGGEGPRLLWRERSIDGIRCHYSWLLCQFIFDNGVIEVIFFETGKVDVGGGHTGWKWSRRWSEDLRLLLSLSKLDRVVLKFLQNCIVQVVQAIIRVIIHLLDCSIPTASPGSLVPVVSSGTPQKQQLNF